MILVRRDHHSVSLDEVRLDRTGLPLALFEEAWHHVSPAKLIRGQHLRITVNMDRTVGLAAIVKAPQVRPNEKTTFARRKNTLHNRPSRVIKLDGPMPRSQYITIIGDWHSQQNCWEVRTAYAGQYVYPQPWDFPAIVKNGFTLGPVLDWWCKAAFLWRGRDFETALHEDTWAGLIDDAARIQRPVTVERVGYKLVRQQWETSHADHNDHRVEDTPIAGDRVHPDIRSGEDDVRSGQDDAETGKQATRSGA